MNKYTIFRNFVTVTILKNRNYIVQGVIQGKDVRDRAESNETVSYSYTGMRITNHISFESDDLVEFMLFLRRGIRQRGLTAERIRCAPSDSHALRSTLQEDAIVIIVDLD